MPLLKGWPEGCLEVECTQIKWALEGREACMGCPWLCNRMSWLAVGLVCQAVEPVEPTYVCDFYEQPLGHEA